MKAPDKDSSDAMMDGMTPVSGLAAEQWGISLSTHADLELGKAAVAEVTFPEAMKALEKFE